MEFWSARWKSLPVEIETIFFGGGTPSLMENDLLVKTGEAVRRHFLLAPNFEWTFECNPETITPEKIEALRAAGATRLSVGIQSFQDRHLERLERRARRGDNIRALETLKKHWSGPWSLDLMFGLPGQNLAEWNDELAMVRHFSPGHVSAYQLTLTTLRSQNWQQAPEDDLLEMFDRTEEALAEQGLKKYETSNFARKDEACRHNLRYWNLESFLGLGPGGSGLLSQKLFPDAKARYGVHQKQPDRWDTWQKHAGNADSEMSALTSRTPFQHLEEMLMMGLRLESGISAHRLGDWNQTFFDLVSESQYRDFIEYDNECWKVTPRGARTLDSLLSRLFKDLEKRGLGDLDSREIDPKF